jgi:hypothetical protein
MEPAGEGNAILCSDQEAVKYWPQILADGPDHRHKEFRNEVTGNHLVFFSIAGLLFALLVCSDPFIA